MREVEKERNVYERTVEGRDEEEGEGEREGE